MIEPKKKRGRGRPKGSKNKPKRGTVQGTEVQKRRGMEGIKQKATTVAFREDLVIRPSDKPKLRKSLLQTVDQAEEAKVLIREMFLRELVEKWEAWCEANGVKMPRSIGMFTIKKIPSEILSELTPSQMRLYVSMLKDLATTQLTALKLMDPFETGKTATQIKNEATQPQKTFQELLAETVAKKAQGLEDEEEDDED